MSKEFFSEENINYFIQEALKEDVGEGDHTTQAVIPSDKTGELAIISKDSGILAGLDIAKRIFAALDRNLTFTYEKKEGEDFKEGETLLRIQGKIKPILIGERLVLNCLQRMSGIATLTRQVVEQLEGTNCKVLDTRKTTPNFRLLEKLAVKIGGGKNHRFGLYDKIMLKDNHIDQAGGITKAVGLCKEYLEKKGKSLQIEVETRTLEEVEEAINTNLVDIIMLDNMDAVTMKKAVTIIDGKCKSEASGGITIKNVREVAETGVDYISMGSITYAARALDLSMISLN